MNEIFPFEMEVGSRATVVSPAYFAGMVLKRDTVDRWSRDDDPSCTWTSPSPGTSMLVVPLSSRAA